MELPRRKRDDAFLPDGTFRNQVAALRQMTDAHDLGDRNHVRVRFSYAHAAILVHPTSGWRRVRSAFSGTCCTKRLHQPANRTAAVVAERASQPDALEGKAAGHPHGVPMQVHAEPAYAMIQDAHGMGEARPLILAGGPKAIYEPTDFLELDRRPVSAPTA